jgi:hypothetical protein
MDAVPSCIRLLLCLWVCAAESIYFSSLRDLSAAIFICTHLHLVEYLLAVRTSVAATYFGW